MPLPDPSLGVVPALFCCQGWARAEELGAILGKNLSLFWRASDLRARKVLMVELSEPYWPKSLLRTAGGTLSGAGPDGCCRSHREAQWDGFLSCRVASQPSPRQSCSTTVLHCKLCFMDLTAPLHCSHSLYGSQPSKATNNHYFYLN